MNAVSINLEDGTVTVHLPGQLDNKISTPRTYNFWEIAGTSSLTNNGETKSLSSGSLIAKAIEIIFKKHISRLIIADDDNNLLGIVTRTDLIDSVTNLKQFPIITN